MPEGGQERSAARLDRLSKMPGGGGGVHRLAHLSRLAGDAAVAKRTEEVIDLTRRWRCSTRITRPREGEDRSSNTSPAQAEPRRQGADSSASSALRGSATSPRARSPSRSAQVRARLARRDARPRPRSAATPDLHRRAAGTNRPGAAPRRVERTRSSSSTRSTSSAPTSAAIPPSALLEVLDPETETTPSAIHYLDVQFDSPKCCSSRRRTCSIRSGRAARAWKCSRSPATPRKRS